MSKGTLEIHSENILPIIKKWLYSDRDIFVRELISNSVDAIHKVKFLQDEKEIEKTETSFRIDLKINKEEKTLQFIDNGIGMTQEEVKKYIAQIAFSGAEDFVKAYEKKKEKEEFIGHFGLGFYSAYMVADRVEIDTLSWKKGEEPAFWSCDGSSEYFLEKGKKEIPGTIITLHINQDSDEFLDDHKLKTILRNYCSFLPFPIYLNDEHINSEEPLWVKPALECKKEDYLRFYRHLYPMEQDPLFWVHLNVDYPFHLQGILYFPKLTKEFDLNKSSIKLFCNRVFVSDNCKDLMPQYLTILKGAIDSPDIPLNVSRSYLQMDRTVRQLGSHIAKKVADALSVFYRDEKDRFITCWEDIHPIVKLGAVEDAKFYEKVKPLLLWKTTEGEWLTVEEYLEKNQDKTNQVIFYTKEEHHSHHLFSMYKKKGIQILTAPFPIDTYLLSFLEGKIQPAKFVRIDSEIGESLLDKTREKNILDSDGKTKATKLSEWIQKHLADEEITVEAKSLSDDSVPGVILIDENQRRMKDYFMSMDPKQMKNFPIKKTFVVNTNHPLVTLLEKVQNQDPELAKEMIQEVYELSLLSQREMEAIGVNPFIQRTLKIFESLTKKMVEKQ